MSSIHEALALDVNRGRTHKTNQIVLASHQEATDGPIGMDFFARKEMEHRQEQERRRAEGGKHGGFFDRQVVVERRTDLPAEDDGDVDEFGRRRKPKQASQELSKSERAQLALSRLRKQQQGPTPAASSSAASGGAAGGPA